MNGRTVLLLFLLKGNILIEFPMLGATKVPGYEGGFVLWEVSHLRGTFPQ